MKELLNRTTLNYLRDRAGGVLTPEETNILGNAINLIAEYGGMLDTKQLAYYAGTGTRKLTLTIQSAISKFMHNELYWEKARPTREKFLLALAAGLIEYGYWVETDSEPEERKIARKTISAMAPATIVGNRAEFKGYLAVIEYLWFSVQGNDLKPKVWMHQRYGSKSDIKPKIDAFLDALAVYGKDADERSSRMLLTDLKIEALKIWRHEDDALPSPQREKALQPIPAERTLDSNPIS